MLISVILIAAILRLAGLGRVPPGLYRDEAFYRLDAVNVLHGQHADGDTTAKYDQTRRV